MSTRERLFQMLLFEGIAIVLLTILGKLVSDKDTGIIGGTAIAISLIAMIWNFIYNILFDRLAGPNRLQRSLRVRLLHTTGFEIGILVLTIPTIMIGLKISLTKAIILDLGAMIFFLFFTFFFNLFYDHTRNLLLSNRTKF